MDEGSHTLLIVDDEPFNLDILQEHLEDEGYNVVTAGSGEQALEILSNIGDEISSILLDRMMPGMDGMEVLKKIKEESKYKHIPVIMQTAAASDANVIEGLEAGAFYYLTKPFEPELVVTVVKSALMDHENFLKTVDAGREVDELMPMISNITLTFKTIDEAHVAIGRVAKMFPDPDKVILGMSELVINAIEHGNLAITYDEKSNLLAENKWMNEIEARLLDEKYKEKEVKLTIIKKSEEVIVVIEDEGDGFDWRSFIKVNLERVYDSHGRGIVMASMACFDSLTYNEKGNEVTGVVKA